MSHYIERIHINRVRHLHDFDIEIGPPDENSPRHLILTGPNGSGKTSLVDAITNYLEGVASPEFPSVSNYRAALEASSKQLQVLDQKLQAATGAERAALLTQRSAHEQSIQNVGNALKRYSMLDLISDDLAGIYHKYKKGDFIIASFPAHRETKMSMPTGVKKTKPQVKYNIRDLARSEFLNYLVHLTVQRSFARDSNDERGVAEIDGWFAKLEAALRDIYEDPGLRLLFDRDNYRHTIQLSDQREPFDLNQLADGYHAVLSILSELILRMETKASKAYDVPGIVLIDEVETHLHIEMQKKALPFLTAFFPKIQFIVTTHSPFVCSSIPNAVVYDLASHMREQDLTGYSSEAIVQGHFNQSKYSESLRDELEEYRTLWGRQDTLSGSERDRFDDLRTKLHDLPKAFSPELEAALRDIEGA
jgi:predicted ATP-dependent endonuclease of OLD family